MTHLTCLRTSFLGALLLAAALPAGAAPHTDEPDTVLVRTFTFDDIETRRGVFDFPTAGRTWQRILMHYTLKCDDATTADPYPCGEWDVTTHTKVHVHTGRMDSTRHEDPSFTVEGASPAQFRYSREPRFHHVAAWSDPDGPRPGDRYLRFEGTDCIALPPAAMAGIDSSLTVSLWVRGAADQPRAQNLLEAGSVGGRAVNIHLPWSTGTVYWDCGGHFPGNNNRLSRHAEPGDFKGRWSHWAFTKDARTGEMAIYLDGERWHHAGNMTKAIPPLDSFVLGANLGRDGGWYGGDMDDVRIWDVALDGATIAAWRHRPITPDHPAYAHLRAEYRFDDPRRPGRDSSPRGNHGESFGQPQTRPHGLLGDADLKPGPAAVLRTDSIPAPQLTVRFFEDPTAPRAPTREMDVWPDHDSLFDPFGNLLAEIPADDPEVLEQRPHVWYGDPFEVIETYELARFITPYGKGLDLGETGFSWVQDVTDYAPLLQGRVDLEAGNLFELLDLEFVFVAGAPPRAVRSIRNLWPLGEHEYGALVDDEAVRTVVVDTDPDAAGFMIRSRISGHGHSGPRNCCEWDAKDHILLVGGVERFRWTVWRDCGRNPVFPQGGTWQFDRAGWCPGTFVDTYDHDLTPWVRPGDQMAIDYTVEPYDPAIAEDTGRYIVSHQLFTYDAPAHAVDAAVIDVVAPSTADEHRRLNPVSGDAIVHIRNLGSGTLTSLQLDYGLEGGARSTHQWRGELPFLASAAVVLPAPDWTGMQAGSRFTVTVTPTGSERDEQPGNDSLTVPVTPPLLLPDEFLVEVETPGFGRAADNRWTITDRGGRTVASREDFEDGRTYRDRVRLEPGAYTFAFLDREEDGLIRHWWLRGEDPERIGENGALRILDAAGEVLLDLGHDFAERRTLRFFVGRVE